MKKGVVVCGLVLVLCFSLVSAFSFGDLWGKITGEVVFDESNEIYSVSKMVFEGDLLTFEMFGKSYDVFIEFIDNDEVKLSINEEVNLYKVSVGTFFSLDDDIYIEIKNIYSPEIAGAVRMVEFVVHSLCVGLDCYSFDSIEVIYAAEFTATPLSVEPDSWIVELASGVDKPVSILFGIVNLTKNGKTVVIEKFIKVSNEDNSISKRFLMTSESYNSSYDESNLLIGNPHILTTLDSGKKIENTNILLDYTQLIEAIFLDREFDMGGNLVSMSLNGLYSQGDNNEEERKILVGTNLYLVDIETLTEIGDNAAGGLFY